jgi:hypothetical protein
LLELQERKARLWIPARSICGAVGGFCLDEVSRGEVDVAENAQPVSGRPGSIERELIESGAHEAFGLFQRPVHAEDLGPMQPARARKILEPAGPAPAFIAGGPLVGPRPVAKVPAGPQDVAIEDAADDRVDVARQSERRREVLILQARLGLAKAELEEAAIDQAERLHDRIVKLAADGIGPLGKSECSLRLGLCGRDARSHPAPQPVFSAAVRGIDQRRRALVPALRDGKVAFLQMDPCQRDCRVGRLQTLPGHTVGGHGTRQRRNGRARLAATFHGERPVLEIGGQELIGGVRCRE